MKKILIACAMMEDELKKVYEETGSTLPVVWVERGFHREPADLKKELQRQINEHQDAEEILLAYGLCGNGMDGVVSENTALILPKFDDCINMMLCTGKRNTRGLAESGKIYLTAGWTKDEESMLSAYERYIEDYGEEMALEVFQMMYEHYKKISLIDTGCYELESVKEFAGKAAELLELEVETVPGSTGILKQLITGEWDENFIIKKPGEPVKAADFNL